MKSKKITVILFLIMVVYSIWIASNVKQPIKKDVGGQIVQPMIVNILKKGLFEVKIVNLGIDDAEITNVEVINLKEGKYCLVQTQTPIKLEPKKGAFIRASGCLKDVNVVDYRLNITVAGETTARALTVYSQERVEAGQRYEMRKFINSRVVGGVYTPKGTDYEVADMGGGP